MKGYPKSVLFITKKQYYNFTVFIVLILCQVCANAQSWTQEATFSGGDRQYCSYFSIGSLGYIGFGNNTEVNDLWAYDPSTNQWTQKASIPEAGGRAEMIAFVINNMAYVGMGLNSVSGTSSEFWQYNPATDTWTQVASYPGAWTRGPFCFSINGKGYVGSGSVYTGMWEYDPVANTWTQKNDLPTGVQRYFGVGFSMGNYGYAGTGVVGSTAQKDFWRYDPVADSWAQMTDVGGSIRVNAISFQTSTNGFIAMGTSNTGTTYNDVWQYNAGNNSWTAVTSYAGGPRLAGAGFSIGCDIYIGVGTNYTGGVFTTSDDFWELPLSSGPSIAVTADTTICAGSSVTLTASGGSSYTWSPDSALSAITGASVMANPATTTIYTVTSGGGGCGGTASVTVSVNQADTASVTISANPAGPVCTGTPVAYTGTPVNGGTAVYQWKINGANTGSNNPVLNLPSPDSGDVVTCIMTSGKACVTGSPATSNSIIVSVIAGPVAGNISADPDTVCSGDSCLLTNAGSAGSIQWQYSTDGINFYSTGDSSATYKTASISQSSYYRVSASGSCGSDTSSLIYVMVDSVPVPLISTNDSLICSADSALIISSGTYTSYRWNDGDTRSYTYANAGGGYWLTVTDINGCSASSAHVNIRVYPVPSVSIVQEGDTLSSYGATSYQWIYNDTALTDATLPLYIARQTGSYTLQITDTNGCTAVSTPLYVTISGVQNISGDNLLLVYPNPASNEVFISFTGSNDVNIIRFFNSLGQEVKRLEVTSGGNIAIPISDLPAGLYELSLSTQTTSVTKKLIKL